MRLEINKDTPYLTLTDELWSVNCGDFGENWLHYNGTALYRIPKAPMNLNKNKNFNYDLIIHLLNAYLALCPHRSTHHTAVQPTLHSSQIGWLLPTYIPTGICQAHLMAACQHWWQSLTQSICYSTNGKLEYPTNNIGAKLVDCFEYYMKCIDKTRIMRWLPVYNV